MISLFHSNFQKRFDAHIRQQFIKGERNSKGAHDFSPKKGYFVFKTKMKMRFGSKVLETGTTKLLTRKVVNLSWCSPLVLVMLP